MIPDVSWVCDERIDVEAELLDAQNKPGDSPSSGGSVQSNHFAYIVPYRSRLEWVLSHAGISMMGDREDNYALMIGGRGWLIPKDSLSSYSLKLRLRGIPWERHEECWKHMQKREVLLDIPAITIKLTQ